MTEHVSAGTRSSERWRRGNEDNQDGEGNYRHVSCGLAKGQDMGSDQKQETMIQH